jgi:hypothetical protein
MSAMFVTNSARRLASRILPKHPRALAQPLIYIKTVVLLFLVLYLRLGTRLGHLPSFRVAAGQPPFCNTAMDMFGPFHIRLNRKTLKEAQVIILTCMTTRTVHLELVTDKSTDTLTTGIPTLCLFTRTSQHVLVRMRNKFCWCTKLP